MKLSQMVVRMRMNVSAFATLDVRPLMNDGRDHS